MNKNQLTKKSKTTAGMSRRDVAKNAFKLSLLLAYGVAGLSASKVYADDYYLAMLPAQACF